MDNVNENNVVEETGNAEDQELVIEAELPTLIEWKKLVENDIKNGRPYKIMESKTDKEIEKILNTLTKKIEEKQKA